ncbi:helix-turn-helix domain-containing protein [Streptomyces sp. BK340]|uniref:nSTAND1 domain-containing NTPase n=1 Tax=Streptomyces sp. BK340 TaxID=2572903 RepID=UPI00119CA19A|nr:AAA family ATPase [Streptomyces sp. BK340]TVZ76912.1 WD40 repeat protein [Streptomyces sp. BK340]
MTSAATGHEAAQEQRVRLGRRLRELRGEAGLTQESLSLRIGSASQTLSDLELGRGRRLPARALFDKYVKACLSELKTDRKTKQDWWEGLLGDYLLLGNLLTRPADQAGVIAPETPDDKCPYPGLRAFTEDMARWFFGRTAQVDELLRLVRTRLDGGAPIFVTGASGAGKSSLLRAGLSPALRRGQSAEDAAGASTVVRITPGPNPLTALEQSSATAEGDGPGPAVLLVDQFEEVFTQCADPEERHAFAARLVALAAGGEGIQRPTPVVLAVRADFLHRCIAVPGLSGAMSKGGLVLGPMTEPELRQAIVGPARTAGLELEPGLVETLLRDLGVQGGRHDAGALPLLAHTLQATWAQGDGRRMTLAGYQASGGIRDAVANTAQGVYDALDPEERQAARRLLLRLVTVDEGGEAVRRRVGEDELAHEGGPSRVALRRLVDQRLVTADDGVVQITHEALVRAWDLLRAWLVEDRDWLRLRRDLTAAAEAWQALGRDPGSLYRGHRLARAVDMAQARRSDLNPLESEFLDRSAAVAESEIEAAAAEAEAARRSNRRLRRLSAALVLLVVVSLGATLLAGRQWQTAESERKAADDKSRIAIADGLAAQSRALLGTRPGLAGLLALAGLRYEANGATTAGAQGALAVPMYPVRPLAGNAGTLTAVAFSPDGRTLATGGTDTKVRLWRADGGGTPVVLSGHTGAVAAVAFGPDGRTLASGSADGSVRVWDVRTGTAAVRLPAQAGAVTAVAFSPDGTKLATGLEDGTARLWNGRTGRALATFTGHTGRVSGVAFSPDGRTLLTGSWDDTARLWNLHTHRSTGVLRGHRGEVYAVAFGPDGTTAATGSADGTARLWDVRTRRGTATLRGHTRVVASVAFSPDGRTLLTGSWDDTARLWNLHSHRSTGVLDGHVGHVNSVAFRPDGRAVATASSDGTVRLWGTTAQNATEVLSGHRDYVDTVAFGSDGRTLATGSRDGTTRLWDPGTGRTTAVLDNRAVPVLAVALDSGAHLLAAGDQEGQTRLWDTRTHRALVTLRGHGGAVDAVAFSPDGSRLATASTDGTARLWDTRTHRCVGTLRGHSGWVDAVAFSPDGRTLATASTDGTARLWDTRTLSGTARFNNADLLNAAAFSPDGKTLALGSSDGTARLWDIKAKTVVRTVTGHTKEVTAIAFSPDGRILATASRDRTTVLFDLRAGRTLATLGDAAGWVTSVAFSPDGKTLATGSWDRSARITPVPRQWPHALCQRAGRNLTHEEWTTYVGDTPYRRLCPEFPTAQTRRPDPDEQ